MADTKSSKSIPKTDLRETAIQRPERLDPDPVVVDDGGGDSDRTSKHRDRTSKHRVRRTAAFAGRTARAAPSAITQRSGSYSGKGILTAELLTGFVLVAIRLVGDYQIQEGGAVKGNIIHPQGQYGPIAILTGLIGSFFLLSFLAAAGGTRAKVAVIIGGCIVLTLGVNTYRGGEITKLASTFGKIGTIAVPPAQGTLPDIYGNTGTAGSSITINPATPSQVAPVAGGAPVPPANQNLVGTNPNVYTKPAGTPGGPLVNVSPSVRQQAANDIVGIIKSTAAGSAQTVADAYALSRLGAALVTGNASAAGNALNSLGAHTKSLVIDTLGSFGIHL